MKKLIIFSVITFVAGVGIGLYFLNNDAVQHSPTTQPEREFTLYSQGLPVSLHDFRGKLVLLFFGYTSCPDVCPLTLNKLAALLNALDDEQRRQVQVLFVSVDPKRDTADKLFKYTQYFDADIIGLTGSKQQIDRVVKLYTAEYRKVEDTTPGPSAEQNYTIDHTASVYVINQQGIWSGLLPSSATVDQWLLTVQQAL